MFRQKKIQYLFNTVGKYDEENVQGIPCFDGDHIFFEQSNDSVSSINAELLELNKKSFFSTSSALKTIADLLKNNNNYSSHLINLNSINQELLKNLTQLQQKQHAETINANMNNSFHLTNLTSRLHGEDALIKKQHTEAINAYINNSLLLTNLMSKLYGEDVRLTELLRNFSDFQGKQYGETINTDVNNSLRLTNLLSRLHGEDVRISTANHELLTNITQFQRIINSDNTYVVLLSLLIIICVAMTVCLIVLIYFKHKKNLESKPSQKVHSELELLHSNM
ncbi:hypothetical protein FQR65_LT01381 [Abscondita terminalis]|nr:hypothetical protein FQR65_LT01381 [Abscondita terminalis]